MQSGSSVTNLGGYGINIALADAGGSPAFISRTSYYFSCPGSDITQIGADAETPTALGDRVLGLFASLAFPKDSNGSWIPLSPTETSYHALARSANSQVQIVLASPDAHINDQVNLVVAGAGGQVLSGGVLANVSDFFAHYSMLTDRVNVISPSVRVITLAGLVIVVRQNQLVAAQTALQSALAVYFSGLDPGKPFTINPRIEHGYIVSLAQSVGALRGSDVALTINGVTGDLVLPVAANAYESPQWTQSVSSAFVWVTE
jgi:hypothetical protein